MLDAEILKAAPQFELPSGLPEGPWRACVKQPREGWLVEAGTAPNKMVIATRLSERIARAIAAIPAMVEEIGRLHEKRQSLARDVVKLALDIESLRALNAELRGEALRLVHTAEGDVLLWSMTTKIAIDRMHTILAKSESQSATTQPRIPGLPVQAPTATPPQPAPGGIIETEKGI